MKLDFNKYANKNSKTDHRPQFFRIYNLPEKKALFELLTNIEGITVYDEIIGQLEELVKSQNPKTVFTKSNLNEAAIAYVGNKPIDEYGVWVYYPWSKNLVHILDEEEFVTVRTNRNQYKITPKEKEILSKKKIGIIGLSVGQSIALTIAMERGCGELRIADFDVLELSNLNRIRTGVYNLGLPKTIAVAREIAEIDPYFNVVCFSDGITEENIDGFILENGKLDIIVDECDGLTVKILCRQKAKYYGIPVVMDTSDKGMLDVERFDIERERPLFHGYIEHLSLDDLTKAKTNEQKVPYLLAILGLDTLSKRMKASMMEIEQTITTWPQLASSVVLGGGLGADVCRRILLNQFHDSGRYFVDIEELISNKIKPENNSEHEKFILRPSLEYPEMIELIKTRNYLEIEGQCELSTELVEKIVTAAVLAPTGANIQPWKWLYFEKNLFLFFDDRYSAGLLDYGNTTSFVGLGAATENVVLKAHELGYEVILEKENLNKDSKLMCVFKFFKNLNTNLKNLSEPHVCDDLVDSIPNRLTNRNIGKRVKIERSRLDKLKNIAETIPGARLRIIDDENILNEIRDVTSVMDRVRVTHKGGHKDFLAEIRWNAEEVQQFRNGVDLLGTVDLTPSELAGWRVLKDWDVVKYLNEWGVGGATEKIQKKSIDASSAVGLLTMPKFDCNNFYESGRVFQRIWLLANKDNICVHPASLSTLIFNTYNYGDKNIFPERMRTEISEMRTKFEKIFSIDEQLGEVILFRFFIGEPPKSRSIRYPLNQVLKVI
jgi:molybdopterin/thiamine biosynthesis adenylyltransferase/nitroreductase